MFLRLTLNGRKPGNYNINQILYFGVIDVRPTDLPPECRTEVRIAGFDQPFYVHESVKEINLQLARKGTVST